MSFKDFLNEAVKAIYDDTRNIVVASGKNVYSFQVEYDKKTKEYYAVFMPDQDEDDEDFEEINTKNIKDVIKFLQKEGAKEKNIEAEVKKIKT